jgi:hypothetical protein
MAMEAAESAYLAQLAADAKADAAAGYVEPWSIPNSVDEFAGREGEDDGGLYGEWNEERWKQEQSSDSFADAEKEEVNGARSSSVHTARDGVIHAEPVSGYEQHAASSHIDDDDDDFYGNGGGGQNLNMPPPPPPPPPSKQPPPKERQPQRQPQQPVKQRVYASQSHGRAPAAAAATAGRDSPIEAQPFVQASGSMCAAPATREAAASLTRGTCRGKPKIILLVEGSGDTPALVFETRGCAFSRRI